MKSKIGAYLRQKREEKKLSLEDIAEHTGIREPYLSALEEGEFNKIPGDVFIRGFLRNYGNYLGLDGNRIVEAYRLGLDPKLVMGEEEKVEIPVKPELPRSSDTIVISRDMFPLRKNQPVKAAEPAKETAAAPAVENPAEETSPETDVKTAKPAEAGAGLGAIAAVELEEAIKADKEAAAQEEAAKKAAEPAAAEEPAEAKPEAEADQQKETAAGTTALAGAAMGTAAGAAASTEAGAAGTKVAEAAAIDATAGTASEEAAVSSPSDPSSASDALGKAQVKAAAVWAAIQDKFHLMMDKIREFIDENLYETVPEEDGGVVAEEPSRGPGFSFKVFATVFGVCLAIFAMVMAYFIFGGKTTPDLQPATNLTDGVKSDHSTQKAPEAKQEEPKKEEKKEEPKPTQKTLGLGNKVTVEITYKKPVWTQTHVDGKVVEAATIPAGSTRTYKGDKEVSLNLGSIRDVEIKVNGKVVPYGEKEWGVANKTFRAN
ncbi:helix-turn-helix domain-containing protein [Acidaminococcus sp. NSJ-142]|jgi:cytoskeletal protein RodZ|uniref:helix-turn-helix domain-containing protein n=1 Tax=Acidaminococcus TaxID=904 RepID=UPI000CF8F8EB|nr:MULTISPECIES: helix-turn-helix domain-containing protein [Acidaminococcus]MCD2435537.1 helix-turn-helix domain-containing protein [Acidaminococcus hominis]RHK01817.1 helix-turn-helix domain-containing protein [Acidaminococcus sp. AM05-11]